MFPFDLVYRRKYGIKWMSDEHKSISFFNEIYDILEDKVVQRVSKIISEMDKNSGMTDQELDTEFENLDLDKIEGL